MTHDFAISSLSTRSDRDPKHQHLPSSSQHLQPHEFPMASSGELGTFEHEKLPDARTYIRLLRISSVKKRGDIKVHCELKAWPKRKVPRYTAISYTWGDRNLHSVILVNGEKMVVRRNCEDVLRKPCRIKGGYFWVDAICINQTDNEEKSFQVANMGDVFAKAHQTLSCVGRHENDSKFLFDRLHRYRRFWSNFSSIGNPETLVEYLDYRVRRDRDCLWPALKRESTKVRLYNAFRMFLERPYFHRVWIYQELVFGQDIQVCCEDRNVDLGLVWQLYLAFNKWIESPIKLPQGIDLRDHAAAMSSARPLLEAGVNSMTRGNLSQITWHVRMLQSEDPRDRIFGTLAMIDWRGKVPIQPDYDKDPFDLAVEVLQRIGYFDSHGRLLSNTIRAAQLLGLPDRPSSRLVNEISRRQSKRFGFLPMEITSMVQDVDLIPMRSRFLAKRICFHNETWQIQPSAWEDSLNWSEPEAGSPTTLLSHTTVQKWVKGDFWDVQETDILLPQEAQPEDWVLIPSDVTRLGQSPNLALIGRDVEDGRVRLVGKALVSGSECWSTGSPLTEDEFKVYLDPRDAIVLAHSCNWKDMAKGFPSKQDEPHMFEVDHYFDTRLCVQGGHSYALPQQSVC